MAAFLASTLGVAGCGASTTTDASSDTTAAPNGEGRSAPSPSPGQNSCRRGITNDPYPGRCHDYVDTDGDNICDRSQSGADDLSTAVGVAADPDASDEPSMGGCPLGPCPICGICSTLS